MISFRLANRKLCYEMCSFASCIWKLEWLAEWKQWAKINLNKELNYYTLKKLFILVCVDRKSVADV